MVIPDYNRALDLNVVKAGRGESWSQVCAADEISIFQMEFQNFKLLGTSDGFQR